MDLVRLVGMHLTTHGRRFELASFHPMEVASPAANASAHRLDEFPAGYSLAGWSPPEPASASPAGHQYAVIPSCRSRPFHRTANCVLTVCVSRGGKRSHVLPV